VQWHRAKKENAMLLETEVLKYCSIVQSDQQFLKQAIEKLGLSARAM
jgi:predicted ATPase with chaperone activity